MQKAASQWSLGKRLASALLSVVLVVGLAPTVPAGHAWADDSDAAQDATLTDADATAVTVALTIVDATNDNYVLTNEKIDTLTTDNTVADLLAAAGYTAGTQEESAADAMVYFESNGVPCFLGKGADSGNTWLACVDVESDTSDAVSAALVNWYSAFLTANLVNGKHYIYTYGTSSFTYNDTVTDPLAAPSTDTDADTDADADAAADETAITVGAFTAEKADLLIENLNARFAEDGTDEDIDSTTFYAAIALGAQDMSDDINTAAVLKAMNAAKAASDAKVKEATEAGETATPTFTAGTMAKYILALNAADVDCTMVDDNGTTRNLIAEMTDSEFLGDPSELDVWSAVWILPAIDLASDISILDVETDVADEAVTDEVTTDADQESAAADETATDTDKATTDDEKEAVDDEKETVDALVKVILDSQDAETGLFGSVYDGVSYCDSETTAQAIMALLPHKEADTASDKTVTNAIEKAKAALLKMQLSDGGFAYASGDTESNLDATAYVVAALAALGTDPQKTVSTSSGASAMDYLVASADEDMSSYDGATLGDEPMSAAVVLMGLVANAGYQIDGTAFNVYIDTFMEVDPTPIDDDDTNSSSSKSSSSTSSSTTAKTGDATAPLAAGAGIVALCALGAVVALRKRQDC